MAQTDDRRAGFVPAAKDGARLDPPDAGQVFSLFVRNLERLGGPRRAPARPRPRASSGTGKRS